MVGQGAPVLRVLDGTVDMIQNTLENPECLTLRNVIQLQQDQEWSRAVLFPIEASVKSTR